MGDDETSCDSLLQVYKLTAVDKMLAMVSVKAGIEFTYHDLRRTFGRTAWLARVPLATIIASSSSTHCLP